MKKITVLMTIFLWGLSSWAFAPTSQGMTPEDENESGQTAEPTLSEDGFYQLGTVEDLVWFAKAVNEGNTTFNAQLTADIDYSAETELISNATNPFMGIFDGQGHAINVNITATENYTALFRYLGGTIQNLVVSGQLNADASLCAGIAAYIGYGAVIQNCVSNVNIASTIMGNGTHGGIAAHSWGLNLKNSIYTGTISGANDNNCSGLVGWSDDITYIDNCIMVGSLELAQGDNSVFGRKHAVLSNCYYLPTMGNIGTGATEITKEQLESGELCFKLNGDQSQVIWHQTIGEDKYPFPIANGHSQVYATGEMNCDGTPKGGELTYSNAEGTPVPAHEYEEGVCVNCGAKDAHYLEMDEEGFYELDSPGKLRFFASMVNAGEYDLNARLTADIDYSGETQMLGISGRAYMGTFDGQGHKITVNFTTSEEYMALFRYLGGTIRNLVVDGNIETSGRLNAGIAAYISNGGVIENCVSDVDITTTVTGDGTHGGIAAHSWGLTLKNSIYTGKISGETVNNCAGLVGWSDGVSLIEDCIMAGTLEVAEGDNNIFGRRNPSLSNCYYLPTMGSVGAGATEITPELLSSGELCFKLNGDQSHIIWYQTIGEDMYPFPVANGHSQVYANGELNCDGTPKGGVLTYSNVDDGTTIPDHEYEEGICVNCGAQDPDYFIEISEDGYYLLDTPGKLRRFANLVNSGETALNARLTNDIDYSGETAMIGVNGRTYMGTFDGQEHHITVNFTSSEDYMALFRYFGGTIRNLIVDGNIEAHGRLNAGIAAYINNGALIENCISNVNITSSVIGDGTHGGIAAHSWGFTLRNSAYTGTISGEEVSNCAGLVGWSESTTPMENCLMIGSLEVAPGDNNVFGRKSGSPVNCLYMPTMGTVNGGAEIVSQEQLYNGEACFKLNGDQSKIVWFQTLGEDELPVPFNTHGVVYKIEGGYTDYHDDATFLEYRDYTIASETDYLEEVTAEESLVAAYLAQLETLVDADKDTFLATYGEMRDLMKSIQTSAAAYQAYREKADFVKNVLDTNDTFEGSKRDMLMDYLMGDAEPSETFPSGSYSYIWTNHVLSAEDIQKETAWIQQMLDEAIAEGYIAGADITSLMVNADFRNGFNGWYGELGTSIGTSTTGELNGVESNRVFNMYQTLTGMKEGIYMWSMTSGFCPSGEMNSANYAASIYAGENMVYMPAIFETGSEMYNTTTVADAALEGKGMTCILTSVNDGNLTVGMKSLGTGYGSDWAGMANVRLHYLGTLENAAKELDMVLEGQIARAQSLIGSEYSTGEEYAKYPNFSQALKDELNAEIAAASTAETPEEKYAVVEQFSKTFQAAYDSKQLYIAILNKVEMLAGAVEQLYPEHISEEEYNSIMAKQAQAWEDYTNGTLSSENIPQLQPCEVAEDGTFIVKNTLEYLYLVSLLNEGNNLDANIRLEGDITATYPMMIRDFRGTFDGQFHTITLAMETDIEGCALIFDLYGTVKNLIMRGKQVTSNGWTSAVAVRTYRGAYLANIENYVDIESSMVGGSANCGFIVQNWYEMNVDNCLYAGHMTGTSTNCCAGFVGWSSNAMSLNNCLQIATIECGSDGSDTFVNGIAFINNSYYQTPYGRILGGTQTYEEQMASGELCYLLNGDQSNIHWYQTIGEDPHPVLNPTHGVVVKNEDGTFGNATGIQDVVQQKTSSKQKGIFNLMGQKMSKPQKGIYIINGKKLLVK